MRPSKKRNGATVVVALALLLVAGCATDDAGGEPAPTTQVEADPPQPFAPTVPFSVDAVPAGLVPFAAGRGARVGEWGSDTGGTDEPFTVLAPGGDPDEGVVIVAATGFAGTQGGLAQASAGYPDREEATEVDGSPGFRAEPRDPDGAPRDAWPDLVVQRGDDLAVRVTGPGLAFDLLEDLVRATVLPDDRTRAPLVPDPPGDLEVVGSSAVVGRLAEHAYATPVTSAPPGPGLGHSAAWTTPGSFGERDLYVMVLPAGAADLDAVRAGHGWTSGLTSAPVTEMRGDDLVTVSGDGDQALRTLWRPDPRLGLLVVASRGRDLLDAGALVAVADSVRPAATGEWDELAATADAGRSPAPREITRGALADGTTWRLVTGPAHLGGVDLCLRVDGAGTVCPTDKRANARARWAIGGLDPDSPAWTIVVVSSTEAVALRVDPADGSADVPLVPVPGTSDRAAVVVGAGLAVADCWTPTGDGMAMVPVDSARVTVPCP